MKTVAVALCALMCVVGLATANYGYGSYGVPQTGGSGFGGGFGLLICLLVLCMLLGKGTSSSTTFIHGNFSAPTGK